MRLLAVDSSGRGQPIDLDLSRKLGEGATASVYRVELQNVLYAAKLYKPNHSFSGEKLKAMLASPPVDVVKVGNGEALIQYTWVSYLLYDSARSIVGFLMPFVDHASTHSLDTYYDPVLIKRLPGNAPAALSLRLEIALNLCTLISQLHDIGHHFIDIKPQNIRVYRHNHRVVLMDCDGYSIRNHTGVPARFPADLISTDFIAPEVLRNHLSPKSLGENQDRYALGVILFQLLNFGTHPFQGIVTDPSIQVSTNDERAALWLYPYGLRPHPSVKPRPQSIHELLLPETRSLFDEAFTAVARPSAHDWVQHIQGILRNKLLVRCSIHPSDVRHIHFRGQGCIGCKNASDRAKVNGNLSSRPYRITPSADRQTKNGAHHGSANAPFQHPPPGAFNGAGSGNLSDKRVLWASVACFFFIVLWLLSHGNASSPTVNEAVGSAGTVLKSGKPHNFAFPAAASTGFLFNGPSGFRIEVPTGATKLNVRLDIGTPKIDLDLYVRHGRDVSSDPGGDDAYSNGTSASENVSITLNSSPPLRPGTYFIAIRQMNSGVKFIQGVVVATVSGPGGAPFQDPSADAHQIESKSGQVEVSGWLNPKDGQTYVRVPTGWFLMGCSSGDVHCEEDEVPPAEMYISGAFWMGESEVTQAAFQRVMQHNPSEAQSPTWPVANVNWFEAREYCRLVGGRLPTEAEWEYAARAGTKAKSYAVLDEVAWYKGNLGDGYETQPVKMKRPNSLGLYDMLGNVWEWTSSDWDANDQSQKVMRGASWEDDMVFIRVSNRGSSEPSARYASTGFRCVLPD